MPYSVALGTLLPGFGEKRWLFIVVVCIAAMNAGLSYGTRAGAAEDKLFPAFFAQTNTQGAPVWGILISCPVSFYPYWRSLAKIWSLKFVLLLIFLSFAASVSMPFAHGLFGEY